MTLIGSTNEQKIWNYLYAKLGNAYGVAGIMGNIFAESGLNPTNLQNSYETKLGYTDASYTAAVDDGSYTNFIYDKAGYGLVQWTYWSLKRDFYNYAKSAKKSIGNLELQLEFLCKQLSEDYSSVWNTCKSATSVLEASNTMLLKFERPADQSTAVQNKRTSYGQAFYDKYAKAAVVTPVSTPSSNTSSNISPVTQTFPDTPFTVKVIVSDLNYRSSGSMSGKVLGQTGKGSFTITEVNSDGWGKLKSDAGWIYLGNSEYCTIGSTVEDINTIQTTFKAYTVKVTADTLNIHKGAGTGYAKVGKITDKGIYTIVAESNGDGAKKWGKLKSGAGWISLDWCKKL